MTDDEKSLFPSQFHDQGVLPTQFGDLGEGFGGPLGPVPRSFTVVPEFLLQCEALVDDQEVSRVHAIRNGFRVGDYPDPYLNDVLRAFRLIQGCRSYLEIGTFDRGNLAYVSTLLAEDALIIGVDIQDEPVRDAMLKRILRGSQTYVSIIGDSRLPETIAKVTDVLQSRKLDAIFVDGDHTAHAVLCDYSNYEALVSENGIIMLHDCLWEGDKKSKGAADALAEINTVDPVYLIDGTSPPRRFMRTVWRSPIWGVVGVVLAREQAWRHRLRPVLR